jgi:PAB-dependent poly(A)-specific ribonuclease subunit 2
LAYVDFTVKRVGGLRLMIHRHNDFKDLRCMNFTSKGTREILVAGCQEQMFKVDVEKGTVTDTVRTQPLQKERNADT